MQPLLENFGTLSHQPRQSQSKFLGKQPEYGHNTILTYALDWLEGETLVSVLKKVDISVRVPTRVIWLMFTFIDDAST